LLWLPAHSDPLDASCEGPRSLDWVEQLQLRGIIVTRDVMRQQANDVLRSYTGEIYNSYLK